MNDLEISSSEKQEQEKVALEAEILELIKNESFLINVLYRTSFSLTLEDSIALARGLPSKLSEDELKKIIHCLKEDLFIIRKDLELL